MKYFQCSRCKKTKELPDTHFDGQATCTINGVETIVNIVKPEFASDLTCIPHGRRMREITEEQYNTLSP